MRFQKNDENKSKQLTSLLNLNTSLQDRIDNEELQFDHPTDRHVLLAEQSNHVV